MRTLSLKIWVTLILLFLNNLSYTQVKTGMDTLFDNSPYQYLQGKKIGLITNHTALNKGMKTSLTLLLENQETYKYKVIALFGPEHGIDGSGYAYGWEKEGTKYRQEEGTIPIYGLHANTKRPTKKMLEGINLLVFDIQDIGARHYTYATTLFYAMEEAAKYKIPILVTDRPNPINGITVDGPMLDSDLRSFVGYINIPLCHGMTIGELALFFNKEYNIDCDLTVIPMEGWKRSMNFSQTGLTWVPTSPQIPEADTPIYYVSTAILGEGLTSVSTGVGYTLPFKVVGAPWINADLFTKALNDQKYPGIHFEPFHFKPFFGRYQGTECHGARLIVTNQATYRPVSTQFLIMGILKSLYPTEFKRGVSKRSEQQKRMFNLLAGKKNIAEIMENEPYIAWKLRAVSEKDSSDFLKNRKKYLIQSYQ